LVFESRAPQEAEEAKEASRLLEEAEEASRLLEEVKASWMQESRLPEEGYYHSRCSLQWADHSRK